MTPLLVFVLALSAGTAMLAEQAAADGFNDELFPAHRGHRLLPHHRTGLHRARLAKAGLGREARMNAASLRTLKGRARRNLRDSEDGAPDPTPCAANQTWYDAATSTCVEQLSQCSNAGYGFQQTSGNPGLDWLCLNACPNNAGEWGNGFPYDPVWAIPATKNCVIGDRVGTPCDDWGLTADVSTRSCVATCPSARPVVTIDNVCVSRNTKGPQTCCYGLNPYADDSGCPGNPAWDATAGKCVKWCATGSYANSTTNICVTAAECKAMGKFTDDSLDDVRLTMCVSAGGCADPYYFTDEYTHTCATGCELPGLTDCTGTYGGPSCCPIIANTPPEYFWLGDRTITCDTGYSWSYQVEFFKTAQQVRSNGDSSVPWPAAGSYSGYDASNRAKLLFTGGDSCSAGSRSTNVTLHCGNGEYSICGEPNNKGCHYEVHYFTPDACLGVDGAPSLTQPAAKTYKKLTKNYDYPGNDIYSTIMPKCGTTVATCQALCDNVPGCVMFVFGSPSWGKNCCGLKSAIGKSAAVTGLTAYKVV